MVAAAYFSSSLSISSSSIHGRVRISCFDISSVLTADPPKSLKFSQAQKRENVIPMYKCLFSDQLTPVLAYRSLVKENDRDVPSFIFDSVDPDGFHSTSFGRYSIVGAYPAMEIVAKDNRVTIMDHLEGQRTEEFMDDPILLPQRIMQRWTPKLLDELPKVFTGGWAGYFGHGSVQYVDRPLSFSKAAVDDRKLPDMHLGLYDDVIIFDHLEKKTYAIHWVQLDRFSSEKEALDDGESRLDELLTRIHNMILNSSMSSELIELDTRNLCHPKMIKGVASEEYKKAFVQAKKHIKAGKATRVALNQRFERRTFANPFEVYRTMRVACPSPCTTYLQARGSILVASAPENVASFDEVPGKINGSWTVWDAIQAKLPNKHDRRTPKAATIVDEFELDKYDSSAMRIGSISFSGYVDITSTSQSILFPTNAMYDTVYSYDYEKWNKRREWVAQIQSGSLITDESNLKDKDKECKNKASTLSKAIDLAESSFVNKNS